MADVTFEVDVDTSKYDKAMSYLESSTRRASSTIDSSLSKGVAGASAAATSALGRAGATIEAYGGRIAGTGRKIEGIGSSLTRTVTPALVGIGTASVVAAVKIDTSLTNVRKTVDGTEEQYRELKAAALEFSRTNAVSASQILDIQALGAQLGFAIDELGEFGEVVSGLDIATNMDAETAGTEMARFANITKMSHGEIRNYGSAIVGLGNSFATTESGVSSMSMRIAAAGTQIGLSQADILGLATALSSLGIEAEAGGSSISTLMSKIDKAVAGNSESLQDWARVAGISADEFAKKWKTDPVSALTDVMVGIGGLSSAGENMNLILEDLGITELRQVDAMKRMAGNSELLAKAVGVANDEWSANTALQAEVDNRNQSLAARMEMVKNRVIEMAEKFGGPLAEALLAAVNAAEPLFEALANGAQAFADLDEDEQRLILTMFALAAAAGPVLKVVGNGMTRTEALGKALQKLDGFFKRSGSAAKQSATATEAQATASESAEAASKGQTASTQSAAAANSAQASSAKTSAAATSAQATSSKAADGAAKGMATSTRGAAAAMKTFKAALITTGLGALVVVLGEVVANMMAAAKTNDTLTESSRKQKNHVGELNLEYLRLRAEQGETADATLKAKAALDTESAAFEESKQTVAQLMDACSAAVETHDDLVESLAKTETEANSQAGAIMNLADQVATLMDIEGRSTGQKAELTAKAQLLNEALGREAVNYDQASDSANMTSDAVRALAKAEADRTRGEAAMSRYNALMQDSITIDSQLADAQENLEAASKGWGVWIGDFPVLADPAAIAYHDLEKSVGDLEAAQAENTSGMEDALQVAQDCAVHNDALAQAVEAVRTGEMDAAEAAEKFSESTGATVDESEVAVGAFEAEQEAAAELSEEVAKAAEKINDYAAAHPAFTAAMETSGWSADALAQHLSDCGIEVSDLTGAFDDLSSQTMNAFEKIEGKADVSLDSMLTTLQHNADATQSWASNITELYSRAGSQSETAFIDYIASMGVEYAPVIQALLDDSTGMLTELAQAYEQGGDATGNAWIAKMRLAADGSAEVAEEAVERVADELAKGPDAAGDSGGETGAAYGDSLSDELSKCPKEVQAYVLQLESELKKAQAPAASTGANTGAGYTTSLANAIASCPAEVQTHITQLESQLQAFQEQAATTGTTTGTTYGANTSKGINSQISTVSSSANSLATSLKNPLVPVPEFARKAAETTGSKMAQGLQSKVGTVGSASSRVASSAENPLASIDGGGYGSGASSDFARGIAANQSAVDRNADMVVRFQWQWRQLASSAHTWGADAAVQFGWGISYGAPSAIAAANDLADGIRAILHFSVPDIGPLSDADEYGPDFVQLLADGMRSRLGVLKSAAEDTAQVAREGMAIKLDDATLGAFSDTRKLAAELSIPVTLRAASESYKTEAVAFEVREVRDSIDALKKSLGQVIADNVPSETGVRVLNVREVAREMTR